MGNESLGKVPTSYAFWVRHNGQHSCPCLLWRTTPWPAKCRKVGRVGKHRHSLVSQLGNAAQCGVSADSIHDCVTGRGWQHRVTQHYEIFLLCVASWWKNKNANQNVSWRPSVWSSIMQLILKKILHCERSGSDLWLALTSDTFSIPKFN